MAPAFQYEALGSPSTEIRQVVIEPALFQEDEIRCELEAVEIASANYEALSYAWGDATTKCRISLNGQPFDVTTNLEVALRNLRTQSNDPSQKRKFWIDAICIDQGNDVERSEQVQRMSSIYKSADRVVIWLGDYFELEDELVEFNMSIWGFNRLELASLDTTREAFKLAEDLAAEYDFETHEWAAEGTVQPTLDARCWAYLDVLCRRSWFRRLWVIQEVLMAQHAVVVCGRAETTWRILEGAGETMTAYLAVPNRGPIGTLPFIPNLNPDPLFAVALTGLDRANIMVLIRETSRSEATDHRDRLYAIRSLLEVDAIDIDVDYSKTTAEVYRDWARKRIVRTGRLDVMNVCLDSRGTAFELHGERLPSWVPDLRHLSKVDLRLFEISSGLNSQVHFQYAAGGIGPCRLQDHSDENVLSLRGIRIGYVAKLISTEYKYRIRVLSDDLRNALSSLEEQISEHFGPSFEDGGPAYAAFVDVLFKGCRYYNKRDKEQPTRERYNVWKNEGPIPDEYEPLLPEEERRQRYLDKFEMRLALLLVNAEFIVTQNGLLGIASTECNMREGDEIWVLPGANTPVVLQELELRQFYQLQGPCYVHGYMDGQAITEWRMGDLELETVGIV